jgi:hypothetical protein
MDLRFLAPDIRRLEEASAEVLACCAWEDERPMRGVVGLLDWRMAGRLNAIAKEQFFEGRVDELLLVPGKPALPFEKVLVLGLGPRASFDDAIFKRAILRLMKTLEGLHVRRAVVELPGRHDGRIEPERATEILIECVDNSPEHDAWWLVEPPEVEPRILQRANDERRRARRP